MKKSLMLISGLLFAISSFAGDNPPVQNSLSEDPFNHPMFLLISQSALA
jgi:hypothetical protein